MERPFLIGCHPSCRRRLSAPFSFAKHAPAPSQFQKNPPFAAGPPGKAARMSRMPTGRMFIGYAYAWARLGAAVPSTCLRNSKRSSMHGQTPCIAHDKGLSPTRIPAQAIAARYPCMIFPFLRFSLPRQKSGLWGPGSVAFAQIPAGVVFHRLYRSSQSASSLMVSYLILQHNKVLTLYFILMDLS